MADESLSRESANLLGIISTLTIHPTMMNASLPDIDRERRDFGMKTLSEQLHFVRWVIGHDLSDAEEAVQGFMDRFPIFGLDKLVLGLPLSSFGVNLEEDGFILSLALRYKDYDTVTFTYDATGPQASAETGKAIIGQWDFRSEKTRLLHQRHIQNLVLHYSLQFTY